MSFPIEISRCVEAVGNYFSEQSISSKHEWISACVEFVLDNSENETLDEIVQKCYVQWLHTDLTEIEHQTFPRNIKTKEKLVFNGTYCLQLNGVLDISKSAYKQLKTILEMRDPPKRPGPKEEEECGDRMLMLYLTDGVQEFEAYEKKPVPCLSTNIIPGVKIRLTGPFEIRKGCVWLEEKNVEILGGCVETLLETNCYENMLRKILKMDLYVAEQPN